MTDEILNLINGRRRHKNNIIVEHNKINEDINKKIRDAKDKWMDKKLRRA